MTEPAQMTRMGRMDESIEHYWLALQRNSQNAAVHNDLGLVPARKGNLDDAIRQFTEALRLKPDFAPARQALESLSGQKTP